MPDDEDTPMDAAAEAAEEAPPVSDEPAPPEVNQDQLKELTEMGFGECRAVRALHFTENNGVEVAVGWLEAHEDDADIDEPLLVKPKPKLTPEEAKAQAATLLASAKAKREQEEKEREKLREKDRIAMGKEIQAEQRKAESEAHRLAYEQRMREKAEEEAARRKIKVKLLEDKNERRRKLGKPELTFEEWEAEEAEKARKAAEEKKAKQKGAPAAEATGAPAVKPVSVAEKLRACLVAVKKVVGDDKTCFETLLKMLGNVANAPGEAKFLRIRLSNANVHARVGQHADAVKFLCLTGFHKATEAGEDVLVMDDDAVDLALLNAAGAELNSALTNPFFGVL